MSWRYFGRFFRLGLMLIWPAFALGVIVAIATGGQDHDATAIAIGGVVYGFVLDILLTFVVPELTFVTDSATDAWRSGRAIMRATWPRSRWYLVAPGLAVASFGNLLGRLDHTIWVAATVSAATAVLALLLKGTILQYYVRVRPQVVHFATQPQDRAA
jgi:hypothetical protein